MEDRVRAAAGTRDSPFEGRSAFALANTPVSETISPLPQSNSFVPFLFSPIASVQILIHPNITGSRYVHESDQDQYLHDERVVVGKVFHQCPESRIQVACADQVGGQDFHEVAEHFEEQVSIMRRSKIFMQILI